MCIHRYNGHFKRGNGSWPNNAFLVKVLLNGRRNHTCYPNTIATHGHSEWFAIFTQDFTAQCFRVFLTQLEDMTHFDTTFDLQCAFAIWRRVTFNYITQVINFSELCITFPVYAGCMLVSCISTGHKVRKNRSCTVNNDGDTFFNQTLWAYKTSRQAKCCDLLFGCKSEWSCNLCMLLGFNFIQFVIATKE